MLLTIKAPRRMRLPCSISFWVFVCIALSGKSVRPRLAPRHQLPVNRRRPAASRHASHPFSRAVARAPAPSPDRSLSPVRTRSTARPNRLSELPSRPQSAPPPAPPPAPARPVTPRPARHPPQRDPGPADGTAGSAPPCASRRGCRRLRSPPAHRPSPPPGRPRGDTPQPTFGCCPPPLRCVRCSACHRRLLSGPDPPHRHKKAYSRLRQLIHQYSHHAL